MMENKSNKLKVWKKITGKSQKINTKILRR